MEIAEDSPADVSGHEPADGRWLTLAEIGRGISKASAARLVRRHKWRRQAGNDGHVRVFVPPDALEPGQDSPAASPADMRRAINAFEAAIAAAGERAAATIDALQSHLAAERTRGDAAEARADRVEIRAGALADRAHVLQADLGTA